MDAHYTVAWCRPAKCAAFDFPLVIERFLVEPLQCKQHAEVYFDLCVSCPMWSGALTSDNLVIQLLEMAQG